MKDPHYIQYIKQVKYPPFLKEHIVEPKNFGEGGAYTFLHELKDITGTVRVWVLAAINSFASPLANKINKTLLSDKDYEVRLYAFSALNNQENEINNRIIAALQQFEHSSDNKKRAHACKELALLYWELVYQNLTEPELIDDIIKKSILYLNIAQKTYQDDPELFVLRARIHMRKHEYKQAEELFLKALEFNLPVNIVIPYLSELYFIKRDIAKMRAYLTQNPHITDIPIVGPVVDFWRQTT
ncbi:MAG: hypothetical protein KAS93_06890 [Gammaproteobacteria bacterium]|nr:hypothetical protein [Gammaproteobacteria bacterium]